MSRIPVLRAAVVGTGHRAQLFTRGLAEPTERDGALALAVGLAANRSFETGGPVRTDELLAG
ncbi:hypothetical protein [Streptomyces sp. NPDC092370]|uniref:hypothetical protein n=1 Tax=Streptomyces sp. NPDC092370 TaxID=3366016 RepID=UPI00381F943D